MSASETATLLEDVAAYFRRFVVITDEQRDALALWTLHTYVFDVFDLTAYLIISSAEMRSGKTTLLELVESIARAPLKTASLSEAVLFRAIHEYRPTLLLDETDAIFKQTSREPSERVEAIRAILNAGYQRNSYAIRCNNAGQPERFGVFCPKAFAGIGTMPSTIRDRGLSIRLQRRTREEVVERSRYKTRERDGGALRARLEAWSADVAARLAGVVVEMPEELDDRAQDAYEPLVAIADDAGGEWPARARRALVKLRVDGADDEPSRGAQLLADVLLFRDKLDAIGRGETHVATADLLALLYADGLQPWEEWWGEAGGKKAGRRLAHVLGEYGLKPEQYWSEGKKRGYKLAPLFDVLARYTVDAAGDGDELAPDENHAPTDSYRSTVTPESYRDSTVTSGDDGRQKALLTEDSYRYKPEDGESDWRRLEPGSQAWIERAPVDVIRKWYDEHGSGP